MSFKGAFVYMLENQAIPDSQPTMLKWSEALYNHEQSFNPNNPTRLTIPSGVSRIQLSAGVKWQCPKCGYYNPTDRLECRFSRTPVHRTSENPSTAEANAPEPAAAAPTISTPCGLTQETLVDLKVKIKKGDLVYGDFFFKSTGGIPSHLPQNLLPKDELDRCKECGCTIGAHNAVAASLRFMPFPG